MIDYVASSCMLNKVLLL